MLQPTDNYSANWSGYEAYKGSSSTYHSIQSEWNEPSIGTSCTGSAEYIWVGMGGDGTQYLAQDGTAYNASGLGPHQGWSDIRPDQSGAVAQSIYATVGKGFVSEINRISGRFNLFLRDVYTNYSVGFQVYSNSYNGSTAEAILEKPTNRNLSNVGSVYFYNTLVNGSASSNAIGNYPVLRDIISVSGHTVAAPGSLSSNKDAFTDYYYRCN